MRVYTRKHTKCIIEGCAGRGAHQKSGNTYYQRGYCEHHINKINRYGDPLFSPIKIEECKIDNCNSARYALGYCIKHYARFKKHGDANYVAVKVHRKDSPIYGLWRSMKGRCYNKNHKYYHRYGGRGITVCERWFGADGFENFCHDMGDRPTPQHSIDRYPNNDGNYEPENCRWATIHQQTSNRSCNNAVVGVSFSKNTWRVELTVSGIRHRKGFSKYEDAVLYRKELEIKHLKQYEPQRELDLINGFDKINISPV